MSKSIFYMLTIAAVLLAASSFAAGAKKVLPTEPAVVTICGTLNMEEFEEMEVRTVRVPILRPPKPVRVTSDEFGDEGDISAFHINVSDAKGLVFEEVEIKYSGKTVCATGTLFHAHTGYHHAPVMMIMESIREWDGKEEQ